MLDESRSIDEVAAQCIACKFKGSEQCDCCDNMPVVMCVPYTDFVPNNGELALLTEATEKVLLKLQADIKSTATSWKGIDREIYFNAPDIFRGANGQVINQPKLSESELQKLREQPWWEEFCGGTDDS